MMRFYLSQADPAKEGGAEFQELNAELLEQIRAHLASLEGESAPIEEDNKTAEDKKSRRLRAAKKRRDSWEWNKEQ